MMAIPSRKSWFLGTVLLLACRGENRAPNPGRSVQFVREGAPLPSVSLAEFAAAIPTVTWSAFDPLYGKAKRFRTWPVRTVLARGFAGVAGSLEAQEFILRADDGYAVPLRGDTLLQEGAYFAFADDETAGTWEPIGSPDHKPSPLYLVWRQANQTDVKDYPRPWGIVSIEMVAFEKAYARTLPTGEAPDSAAQRGFAIFRGQCLKCHAVNGQGGHLGPELNRPKNITEYRSLDVLRGFVRNPQAYRDSSLMPAQTQLSDAQLDDVLAYLSAMATRKSAEGDTGK